MTTNATTPITMYIHVLLAASGGPGNTSLVVPLLLLATLSHCSVVTSIKEFVATVEGAGASYYDSVIGSEMNRSTGRGDHYELLVHKTVVLISSRHMNHLTRPVPQAIAFTVLN